MPISVVNKSTAARMQNSLAQRAAATQWCTITTKKDGPASRIKKDVHGDDIPKRKSPHATHPKTSHPLQNGVEVGSDIGEHAANIADKQRAVEDSAK